MKMAVNVANSAYMDNECAICNETLKNPKLLSCNHKYCELCINTWISKSKKNSGIECPLCRQITPPQKPGVSAAFWASMLPDFTAGKDIDILCKPCESIQERNAAKFYCLECKENMCVSCRVSHTKFKVLKSHRTVELDCNDENSIQSFKEYSKLLMCDLHPVKEIEFFCEDDDAIFCSTCAFLHHRSCFSVKEIKADYAEIKPVKPLSAISKNLEAIRKKVEKVSAFHNKNNKLLVKNEREITAKLKASEQNILRSLKSFHGEVITKLNEKNRPYNTTNDEKIKICGEVIENLKRAENTAKDTMGVASGSAEYVIISRRLEKRIDEIQNQIETQELSINTSNKYMFEFNEDFFRSLNQIETYGCYKETKCPRLIIEFSTTVNKSSFVPAKAMKISSKLARRKTYFPSACYMFDDKEERMVLADQKKKRLVILSGTGNEDTVKLSFDPYAILITKNSLYVSFPHEKKIRKYAIKRSFEQVGEIRTKHKCYAIDFLLKTSESKIVVSLYDEETWSLAIYIKDGSREVSCIKRDASRNPFTSLWYFKIIEGCVYWSCQDEHSVKALHLESLVVLFAYRNGELKRPGGIGIDSEENIYVCGMASTNIHVLSKEGKLINVVKLDEEFVPTFIAFSDNGADLVFLGNANSPGPFFYQLK